jgi:hypothetical protein
MIPTINRARFMPVPSIQWPFHENSYHYNRGLSNSQPRQKKLFIAHFRAAA